MIAQDFFEIFAGLDRAHGNYQVGETTTEKGKREGRARTLQSPPTLDLWQKHLAGEYGLGIIPIRDDGTVVWACGDIDEYEGLNHNSLDAKASRFGFPVIVARSKSGGAHVFLFFSAPVPADEASTAMARIMAALGFPRIEIFPKQSALGPGATGNWLNMPYFGGATSTRHGVRNGTHLLPAAFIALARELALDRESLAALSFGGAPDDFFLMAPHASKPLQNKGLTGWGAETTPCSTSRYTYVCASAIFQHGTAS